MSKNAGVAEKIAGTPQAWESGELGADERYVRRADPKIEKAVDDALGLQSISIRLPKQLIEAYKHIAAYHGVGYQPLMRDILQRFVPEGLKEVMQAHQERADAADERLREQQRKAA